MSHLVGSRHTKHSLANYIRYNFIKHIMNIIYHLQQSLKTAQLPLPKTTKIYSWPEPHFYSAKQLVSRNELFSWKYQLRLLNVSNKPYHSMIYS